MSDEEFDHQLVDGVAKFNEIYTVIGFQRFSLQLKVAKYLSDLSGVILETEFILNDLVQFLSEKQNQHYSFIKLQDQSTGKMMLEFNVDKVLVNQNRNYLPFIE